ncbi:MAG: hypothetical protein AAF494_13560 [Pseudomonadota bacterium]
MISSVVTKALIFRGFGVLRLLSALLVVLPASGALAEPLDIALMADTETRERLAQADAPLAAARGSLPECEEGCITPREAAAMAFAAGEGERSAGRFLLDIRGGGQSIDGELEQLFFVNSQRDYATLGTLTIAFEPDALDALLRRARVCGAADVVDGQIIVKGCRSDRVFDLNMFTMMQRLGGRRIVVDGEVRLQWIDSRIGQPRPMPNKRGENELGYYQPWVWVRDADQVIFVYDD